MTLWGALSKKSDGNGSCMFFELSLRTNSSNTFQRIDAWEMPLWPHLGTDATAYEVKIHRNDFLREVRNEKKRVAALNVSSYFYFVTVPGVVKDISEIPEECGWMLFQNQKFQVLKEAPHRECHPPDWNFVRAMARRTFSSEVIDLKNRTKILLEDRSDLKYHTLIDEFVDLIVEINAENPTLAQKMAKMVRPFVPMDWIFDEAGD